MSFGLASFGLTPLGKGPAAATSGSTTVTVLASVGGIASSGLTAAVVTTTVIGCSVARVSSAGQASAVSLPTALACTAASDTLSGQSASIILPVTVACSVGAASTVGLVAQVSAPTVVSAATANSAVSGQTASISTGSGIACATAGVQAFGLAASIVIPATVNCAAAAGGSAGLRATISAPTTIACAVATTTVAGQSALIVSGLISIDISKIPTSRIVVFEGSGSRVVIFEGSGNRVRFDTMSAKVPVKVGAKWTVDRDPDEQSHYAADITDELADRNTTIATSAGAVTLILQGVAQLEAFSVQTATVAGVQRIFIVVLLGGVDGTPSADWFWTARVSCANGERFDKTTWFNRVDT